MQVSIIVPFYNAEPYLEACCESLLAQRYPGEGYEIVMIDNNSTDGSAGIVGRHSRIRLLRQSKQGAYAARNTGLKVATGDIIAFTDPDCVVDPNWLTQIVAALADPCRQIVVGSYLPASPSLALTVLADYDNAKNAYIFNSRDSSLYCGYTNNLAARSRLFGEFGLFDERARGADALFTRQVVDRYGCHGVAYIENMQVRHLEICSQFCYYRKARIHAISLQQLKNVVAMRPLSTRERLRVFATMRKRHGYGTIASLLAFAMLGMGLFYWLAGELAGRTTVRIDH